jgi:ribosomal protein S18 acetylase RimI-like enzyme
MGDHSLGVARMRGFKALQFNFVIATNAPSIHLWTSFGFTTLARLPGVFAHPTEGYVDALVMFKAL